MKKVTWPSKISLSIPAMDDARAAFVEELERLMNAPDHAFSDGLFELIAVMERDFHGEEVLMEEIGFPALQIHREQHASVLSAFHHVVPKVMQGDYALARLLLELLSQWFLIHLLKMDTPLAATLKAKGMLEYPMPISSV